MGADIVKRQMRSDVLLAAVLAVGCGGAVTNPGDSIVPVFALPPGATVQLIADRSPVDPLVMHDLSGTPWSMDELRGQVVLVNFWATWCGPCRIEIPDLMKIQSRYGDHVQVIGVSLDEGGVDVVSSFADELQMNYPVVMATPELITQFPGVYALPTTFIVDPDGRVAQKHVGLVNPGVLEQEARVLAALPTDVRVELVDPTEPTHLVDAAHATQIPGLDLTALTPKKKEMALQRLNEDTCSCGCSLTLAQCRINDPHCDVSLPLAQVVVEEVASL